MKWFSKKRPDAEPPAGGPESAQPGSGILTGDAAEDRRSVEVLLDTIAEVTANIDLEPLLRGIVDRSLQVTRAERAILFLGDNPDRLEVRVGRDHEGADLGDAQYSRSVVRKCLEDGLPVRSIVHSDQEALELGRSVYDLKLRAVMCAPMRARNQTVGAIYVDSRAMRREYTARDLALFGAMSAQLAIAVENARLHADSLEKIKLQKDVEIARRIQQHLLPTVPANLQGLDVALRFNVADRASGDTYDFVPLADGRIALVVGDVTGHGVGAALLTHAAQAALRSYLELLTEPGEVIARLNQRLVAGVEAGMFMSLLLVVIDPRARTARYVNAGHPELIHCSARGAKQLEKTGMVLGVVGGQEYGVSPPIALQPGDLLFLRTDGVEETRSPDKETFGEERLLQMLESLRERPAGAILEGVEAALHGHAGSTAAQDDTTMIAVKVL
jgi:sigma-B regulation protein RsbU (phosphoserine phosphatase)